MIAAASTDRMSVKVGTRADVSCAPAPVTGGQRDRASGVLGKLVAGYPHPLGRQLGRNAAADHEHGCGRDLGIGVREVANRGGDFAGRGYERGDEDRDDRVARIRVGQRLERAAVVVGRGGRDHVDRVAERRARGKELGELGSDVGRNLRDLDPGRLAGIRAQDPGAATVGDDHHSVAARALAAPTAARRRRTARAWCRCGSPPPARTARRRSRPRPTASRRYATKSRGHPRRTVRS